jgi:hypothetical protein
VAPGPTRQRSLRRRSRVLAPELGGSNFLRSAAMTAAGIAGGALFEGIQSMFGHHDTAGITGIQAAVPGLGETVLNNHYGAEAGAAGGGSTEEQDGARYDPDLLGSDHPADSGQDFSGQQCELMMIGSQFPVECQERVK